MAKKKKQKYYVVWIGRKKGVFNSWDECKSAVNGFKGAKYKSFLLLEEANKNYLEGYTKTEESQKKNPTKKAAISKAKIISKSISVDAAWNTVTKDMEYQGVFTTLNRRTELKIRGVNYLCKDSVYLSGKISSDVYIENIFHGIKIKLMKGDSIVSEISSDTLGYYSFHIPPFRAAKILVFK